MKSNCLKKMEYVEPVVSKDFTEEDERTMTSPNPVNSPVEVTIRMYAAVGF
jgi:hypothetical protein